LATPNDWLKVSLASQGEASKIQVKHLRQPSGRQGNPPANGNSHP